MKNIMSTVKSVVRHVVDAAKCFVNYIKTVTGKNDSVHEYVEYVEEATTETVVNEDGYVEYVENLETSYDVETVYRRPATIFDVFKAACARADDAAKAAVCLIVDYECDPKEVYASMYVACVNTMLHIVNNLDEHYILVH